MDQDRSNVSPEKDTFNSQTAERTLEMHLIALAMEEISGRPLWQYLDGYEHPEARSLKVAPPLVAAFQCKTIGRTMPL
jgi:hypothetical protein